MEQGWVRTSLCQLPAFTECHPSQRQLPFHQDWSHVEAAALRHWEEDQYKISSEVYNWENGLVRSGVRRYPSSEERELHFGFQALEAAPPREYEDARLSVPGRTPRVRCHGVFDLAFVCRDRNTLRCAAAQFCPSLARRAVAANQPEEQLIRFLALQQTHRGRVNRLNHDCGNWRGVFAALWRSAQEHINFLELRAFLAGVAWRLRNTKYWVLEGLCSWIQPSSLAAVAKRRV